MTLQTATNAAVKSFEKEGPECVWTESENITKSLQKVDACVDRVRKHHETFAKSLCNSMPK